MMMHISISVLPSTFSNDIGGVAGGGRVGADGRRCNNRKDKGGGKSITRIEPFTSPATEQSNHYTTGIQSSNLEYRLAFNLCMYVRRISEF